MAQINLLNKTTSTSKFSFVSLVTSVGIKLAVLAFIAAVGYYSYLFYSVKQRSGEIIKVQNAIKDNQEKIRNFDRRDEIITRQGQVKELKELYKNQIFWSKLIPELARVTLRTATFLSFSASAPDAKVTITAQVPGFSKLDAFLSVFDLPQYNRCISDVKLNSISNSKAGDVLQTKFDVTLKVSPVLFKQSTGGGSASSTSSTLCK